MEKNIPQHIAIIMDGNGRWAKKRGLARSFGHMEGAKSLRRALEYFTEIGVKYLTVYAFSTENWSRPKDEVSTLMKLFLKYIKSERKNMMKNKIRFFVSGRKNNIPEKLLNEIEKLKEETKNNDKIILNIAFNYGSRAEIIDAVNDIIKDGKENITEEELYKKKEIKTSFGETLSWDYLTFARKNPIEWNIPTYILYGKKDLMK